MSDNSNEGNRNEIDNSNQEVVVELPHLTSGNEEEITGKQTDDFDEQLSSTNNVMSS